jgi:2-haloacid dehalogenase
MTGDNVQALFFDTFGTLVDWRTSVIRELKWLGVHRGIEADWTQFADDWRKMYQPAMDGVRKGDREWRNLDALHRESLITLLSRYNIEGLTEDEIDDLNRVWHRLHPWPDTVEGMNRLAKRFILNPMSNGNVRLLTDLARFARLPFHLILGAEAVRCYKPLPQSYLGNAELLMLDPSEIMMVAAHNTDLAAARKLGFQTAFVRRPTEYGHAQTKDLKADSDWDVVADSMIEVADALDC